MVAIRDGRTSSEIVRKRSYKAELDEMGSMLAETEEETDEQQHEELAVLDRSGRLQIPKEHLEAMGLRGGDRVKVELDGDGKGIRLIPPSQ